MQLQYIIVILSLSLLWLLIILQLHVQGWMSPDQLIIPFFHTFGDLGEIFKDLLWPARPSTTLELNAVALKTSMKENACGLTKSSGRDWHGCRGLAGRQGAAVACTLPKPKILSCNCWRQKGAPHTHTYTHQHAQNGSSCKVLVTVPALVAARHVQLGELNEMLSYSFYVHYSGSQSVQSPKQTVGQNLPVSTR